MNKSQYPAYATFISPSRGAWMRILINLVMRIAVKWQLGLIIDVTSLRKRMDRLNRQAAPTVANVSRKAVSCDGVPAEWLIPTDCRQERVLFYIHGGAFVARTPELHAAMVFPWCETLRSRALMVDYRLAPEHRYPSALNDCSQAYRWLLRQGVQASNIVIAGDSAGGNLALATLQRLKVEGLPQPACAVLLSPFVDFTLSGNSALSNARRDPIFTPAFAIGIRSFYADPLDYSDPEVSPLFGQFEGLPPTLIQVGSGEMLLDDAVRVAAAANDAGVQVQLEIWDRLPHVFQSIPVLPQAQGAAISIQNFIRSVARWGE